MNTSLIQDLCALASLLLALTALGLLIGYWS